MAGKANFSLIQGDTFRKSCTYKVKDGSPVDLTGAVVSGKVGTTDFTCAITDALAGKFKFELSSAQTAALVAGVSVYEVQVTMSNGDVKTLMSGNIVVTKQVA